MGPMGALRVQFKRRPMSIPSAAARESETPARQSKYSGVNGPLHLAARRSSLPASQPGIACALAPAHTRRRRWYRNCPVSSPAAHVITRRRGLLVERFSIPGEERSEKRRKGVGGDEEAEAYKGH